MVVAMFIILSIVSCFVASRLDSLSFFLVSMSWLHFKLVKCWSWIVFTDIFYWSQLFRTKNFAAYCFYVACVWNILHYYYTMAGAKKSNQYWPKLIWHQANQNGQILPNFSNFIASDIDKVWEEDCWYKSYLRCSDPWPNCCQLQTVQRQSCQVWRFDQKVQIWRCPSFLAPGPPRRPVNMEEVRSNFAIFSLWLVTQLCKETSRRYSYPNNTFQGPTLQRDYWQNDILLHYEWI